MTRLLTLFGLLAMALLPAPRAYACSCVLAPADERPLAGTVFYGDVLRREVAGTRATYVVAVERVYSGTVGPVAEVHTDSSGASCGLEIPASGRAVVWAVERDGRLRADLCGGTHSVTEPPASLGEGRPPSAATPPASTPAPSTPPPSPAAQAPTAGTGALPVAATFAVVGLGLLVTRRRR
ncbi:MAG TPA: hypothetical protein VGX28_17155 [Frankiaceae bacterium]|jgi:hypothetical protein|nr:hypothetical protein [Frankiaceae bacterium]